MLIQTMDDARTRYIGNGWIVMKQRIQYRAIRVTRARMYHQVARFINDNNVFIFIDDIQRDILRFKTRFFSISALMATCSPPNTFSFGLSQTLPLTSTRWSRIHSFIREREYPGTFRPKPDLALTELVFGHCCSELYSLCQIYCFFVYRWGFTALPFNIVCYCSWS